MKELNPKQEVGFSVDAGLIQRLGFELVGRAETAVSELIKNSYDADARVVSVEFVDSYGEGGNLIITDNGVGMSLSQLVDGFMRISSADKVHNPFSMRYHRNKAGRKGIGRFAAQRLGEELTIITQTKDSDKAIMLTIDWNQYTIDRELSSITFPISYIDKEIEEGTILRINRLRDKWSDAAIMRVYKYVLDLFQPDYLSDNSKNSRIAIQNSASFKVDFYRVQQGERFPFINDKIGVFDKALATFEGYVENHKGLVVIQSSALGIEDILDIGDTFTCLSNHVHFKIYYFIYNRPQYYAGKVSSKDLNIVQELSKTASGVRLYRNGFRVLPYGESGDDWTRLDRRWTSESGQTNVPMANKNLFGFVEVIDPEGVTFEETASREGLIENEAFLQLTNFVNLALVKAKERVAEKILIFKNSSQHNDDYTQDSDQRKQSEQDMFNRLRDIIHASSKKDSDSEDEEKKILEGYELINKLQSLIEEAGMLRVLAGLGLTIGEFTHEIKQYQPSVYGYISRLNQSDVDLKIKEMIDALRREFDQLFGYTKYFSTTISQNTSRQREPVNVLDVVNLFVDTIRNDLKKNLFEIDIKPYDYDVITVPMHKSEWSSVLYNLYTNSRKAIKRANVLGKILIEVDSDEDNVMVYFQDNGDGIPIQNRDRVFNAFFSTSVPASFDAPDNEQLVGTGLGLKIVKDIILSYRGEILLVDATNGYSTCFKIIIPKNK